MYPFLFFSRRPRVGVRQDMCCTLFRFKKTACFYWDLRAFTVNNTLVHLGAVDFNWEWNNWGSLVLRGKTGCRLSSNLVQIPRRALSTLNHRSFRCTRRANLASGTRTFDHNRADQGVKQRGPIPHPILSGNHKVYPGIYTLYNKPPNSSTIYLTLSTLFTSFGQRRVARLWLHKKKTSKQPR